MHRREFLSASAVVALGALGASAAEATGQPRQYFELRTYTFASDEKRKAFAEFLGRTMVPALNRAGIKPVGVFELKLEDNAAMKLPKDPMELWVLLPHDSLESVVGLEAKLAADAAYQDAGKAILMTPKSDPAFDRYASTLLLAMENFPRVAATSSQAPQRIFELRTYESRNPERAKNKLEMFNAGEFGVFERAGMHGVFYGGAIVGENLPQLTYMVMHDTLESAKSHWDTFRKDSDWKVLSAKPEYKDNVSKIIDRYVRPIEGSQI
jgi:hypothetical protein